MNDFADTHLAADFDGQDWEGDWYEMPGDDGWSERYDYADEDFGGEDSYLDSYWEGLAESQSAFWGGE